MFRKLKVDNFKSLVNFSIDFSPMSVIIGNNATGKSSVLQAIDFLCSSVKEDFGIMLERRGWSADNIKSKLINSNKIHFESNILLYSDEGDLSYDWKMVLSIYTGKNEVSLLSESLVCNGEIPGQHTKMLSQGNVSDPPRHTGANLMQFTAESYSIRVCSGPANAPGCFWWWRSPNVYWGKAL